MSYQHIRGAIEMATGISLQADGITRIFYDNVHYTQPSADQAYAVIDISFVNATQDVVGCVGRDDVAGTVAVFIYTPTGGASSVGEQAALGVLRTWCGTGAPDDFIGGDAHVRFRNLDGPRTINGPDAQPHHLHSIGADFRGRIA